MKSRGTVSPTSAGKTAEAMGGQPEILFNLCTIKFELRVSHPGIFLGSGLGSGGIPLPTWGRVNRFRWCQHGVLFDMSGAGKSVIVAGQLAQIGQRFGFRLIVEEGLSHAVLTQTQVCEPVVINPGLRLASGSSHSSPLSDTTGSTRIDKSGLHHPRRRAPERNGPAPVRRP